MCLTNVRISKHIAIVATPRLEHQLCDAASDVDHGVRNIEGSAALIRYILKCHGFSAKLQQDSFWNDVR